MVTVLQVPWLCIGILGALTFYLGLRVSLVRRKIGVEKDVKTKQTIEEIDLHYAIRAHGNTIEYVPMLCILYFVMIYLNLAHNPYVNALIVLTTFGRLLAAYGITVHLRGYHVAKFFGALSTYAGGFFLSMILILYSLEALPKSLQ